MTVEIRTDSTFTIEGDFQPLLSFCVSYIPRGGRLGLVDLKPLKANTTKEKEKFCFLCSAVFLVIDDKV